MSRTLVGKPDSDSGCAESLAGYGFGGFLNRKARSFQPMTDRDAVFAEKWKREAVNEMEAARMFNAEVRPVSWAWKFAPPTPQNTEPRF